MVLVRQEKPPRKVSQGSLTIESAIVEPAETEAGKAVTLKYKYRATDIIDTALELQEGLIITCPDGPPVEAKGICRLTHFQHGDGGRMDGAGKRERSITAFKPGTYKCRIEFKAAGYSVSAAREVSFTVKERLKPPSQPGATGTTTGAATIPPGTPIWVLKKVDIDPQKIAENDAKQPERERQHWQVSPNSASATYQAPLGNPNNGPMMQVSLTFGGAVPSVLRPGDKFDVTMTLKAGPEKNISGSVGIGGRVDASGLKVTRTPTDVAEGAGAVGNKFVASQQITYHCEVPKDSNPRFQKEIVVSRVLSGRGALAVCHYVADVASATTPPTGGTDQQPPSEESGQPPVITSVADTDTARGALSVRLQSPTMVLVPGEPSWPNNVGVTGWQRNGDRIEIDIPVTDNWGSLRVNRNLVVAPGPTSKPTSSMTGPEDWFQEEWSARIGARAGSYAVPIIARQAGAGEAMTTLTIYVIPKGLSGLGPSSTAPGTTPGPRPAVGSNASTLRARLASPTIDLVPGEPSKINGVYVSGWRNNTTDRVEVDMELADNWGSLKVNPKIVAAPAPTSENPANMTSGEHYFSLMWSARLGALPGTFSVPITVRQKGAGATVITLTVHILPKSTRAPGTAGSIGGSTGTAPGPKPATTGLSGSTRLPLAELGCDLETQNGRILVGVMTRDCEFLKAGLRFGDEIKAVNGREVAGLPLTEVAAMLRQSRGKSVNLFIARGDKEVFGTTCRVP